MIGGLVKNILCMSTFTCSPQWVFVPLLQDSNFKWSHLKVTPSQLHIKGWAFGRAFQESFCALGFEYSHWLFFHLFYVYHPMRNSWVNLKEILEFYCFIPYANSYKRMSVSYNRMFFRVVGAHMSSFFWEDSKDKCPLVEVYWARAHYDSPLRITL